MRKVQLLFAFMLFVWMSGCSGITEQDLADLQSINSIAKQEALLRISIEQDFPLNLIDGFVNTENQDKAIAIMVKLLLSGEESKDMELSILNALGQLGKRADVPVSPLIEKLKDKDPQIRAQAIEALGKTGNKEAVPLLVNLLKENAPYEYAVIWALGEIGDKRAVHTLNSLLGSKDKYARYNAYRALEKIGTVTDQVEASLPKTNRNKNGPFDIASIVFRKYQDTMMAMFERIAGQKGVRGKT